jgi:gas vesicle protein
MNERMYYSRDAEQRAQRQQFILVLLAGSLSLAVGAILTLLLAPFKGADLRRMVSEQVNEAAETLKERVQDARR